MPKQAAKLRWYFCNEIMPVVREDKEVLIKYGVRALHNSPALSSLFSAVGFVLSLFFPSFDYSLAEIINLCVGKHW